MKFLRIKVVVPVTTEYYDAAVEEDFMKVVHSDTEINVVSLTRGPFRIQSVYDESFSVPFVLEKLKKAEEEGKDLWE